MRTTLAALCLFLISPVWGSPAQENVPVTSGEITESHSGGKQTKDAREADVRARTSQASIQCNAQIRKEDRALPADKRVTADALEEKIRECMIDELDRDLEMVGNRIYGFREDVRLPSELRCSKYDFRTFHSCVRTQFFRPSGRVYFDVGNDQPDEVDLFRDGNLSPSIDFISLYIPLRLGHPSYYDSWSWGPALGLGITAAAQNSEDGASEASSAPVAMLSAGIQMEYKLEKGPALAVELGYAVGFSSDESFSNSNSRSDFAVYLGLKINVPDKAKDD